MGIAWRKTVVFKNKEVIDYLQDENNIPWGCKDKFIEKAVLEKITRENLILTKEEILETIEGGFKKYANNINVKQDNEIDKKEEESILAVLNFDGM